MKRENRILAITAILSFVSAFLFQHDEAYKFTPVRLLITAAGIVVYCLLLYVRKADAERRRTTVLCAVMGLGTLAMMQGISWLRRQEDITNETINGSTMVLLFLLVVWYVVCICVERGVTENTVTLVIFAGFLMRLFYAVMTQAHLLQNDLGALVDNDYEHLGYVYRIFSTGRLPWENPLGLYEIYHPPLHYIIAALCLRIYALLGVDQGIWDEVLQMLPVFYGTAAAVFLNKLGLRLHCSPLGRCVMLGLVSFLPYSIYLGGALNNDPLVTLLMILCVYCTVKWYEEPKLKNILIMAVCIGGAMMAKLSGAMIAPAMAVVMLRKAWQKRTEWKRWAGQFLCFGLIAFPAGLWYSVWQWVRYRVPFGFVMPVSDEAPQYIGMYSKWDRFRDYGHALETLALRWGPPPDVDYNIPVSLVKFSVFNELGYYSSIPVTNLLGTIMFWATAVMFILIAAAFAGWLFMREYKMIYKIFFGTGIIVILCAYVKFCLKYPHVCTMNVRYVLTAVYIGMLVLGLAVSGLQKRLSGKSIAAGRAFEVLAGGLTAAYMLCSVLLNFNLERILF